MPATDQRGLESTPEDIQKILEQHCSAILEHADTVHIFATRHDPVKRETAYVTFGIGNFYARYGGIKEWILREEERPRASVRE